MKFTRRDWRSILALCLLREGLKVQKDRKKLVEDYDCLE
jgi:hypothetical protein